MLYAATIICAICGSAPTDPTKFDAVGPPPVVVQRVFASEQLQSALGQHAAAARNAGANLGRLGGSASNTVVLNSVRLLSWQVGGQPAGLSLRPMMSAPSPFGSGAYLSAQPNEPVGFIQYMPVFDLPPAWELQLDKAIDIAVLVGGVATVGTVIYSLVQGNT